MNTRTKMNIVCHYKLRQQFIISLFFPFPSCVCFFCKCLIYKSTLDTKYLAVFLLNREDSLLSSRKGMVEVYCCVLFFQSKMWIFCLHDKACVSSLWLFSLSLCKGSFKCDVACVECLLWYSILCLWKVFTCRKLYT